MCVIWNTPGEDSCFYRVESVPENRQFDSVQSCVLLCIKPNKIHIRVKLPTFAHMFSTKFSTVLLTFVENYPRAELARVVRMAWRS